MCGSRLDIESQPSSVRFHLRSILTVLYLSCANCQRFGHFTVTIFFLPLHRLITHCERCDSAWKMHRANQIYSILSISLIAFITRIRCDDILGCGGFIKSHADIDFSRVEIKL